MYDFKFRVVAYKQDGAVFCPDCWICDTDKEEREAAMSETKAEELAGEQGLFCDSCGAVIIPISEPGQY